MNKSIQAGFTLIELIIVIVILGILSVTAAPRFIDIQGDARAAQMSAIEGALKSANSLIYSKAIINSEQKESTGSVSVGTDTVSTTFGYISASAANIIKTLDGSYEIMTNADDTITADWGIYDIPSTSSVFIVPQGFATFDSCSLRYLTDDSNADDPVFYALTITGC